MDVKKKAKCVKDAQFLTVGGLYAIHRDPGFSEGFIHDDAFRTRSVKVLMQDDVIEIIPASTSLPEEPAATPDTDPKPDQVFQPNHYARYVIEPATFIAANGLPFDVGNVVKYVLRYDAKNGREDILKARRYCDMLLERVDRQARVAAGEDKRDVWKVAL